MFVTLVSQEIHQLENVKVDLLCYVMDVADITWGSAKTL